MTPIKLEPILENMLTLLQFEKLYYNRIGELSLCVFGLDKINIIKLHKWSDTHKSEVMKPDCLKKIRNHMSLNKYNQQS